MRQKYVLLKDDDNKQLIIREFAELDKDLMSLLCEETYDAKAVKAAIAGGKEALIAALRTKNLYPPRIYSDKIADAVAEVFRAKDTDSMELFFDDIELLTKERERLEAVEEDIDEDIDEDADELDELLDSDDDSLFSGKQRLDKLDSSLKIEDDEYADMDDES